MNNSDPQAPILDDAEPASVNPNLDALEAMVLTSPARYSVRVCKREGSAFGATIAQWDGQAWDVFKMSAHLARHHGPGSYTCTAYDKTTKRSAKAATFQVDNVSEAEPISSGESEQRQPRDTPEIERIVSTLARICERIEKLEATPKPDARADTLTTRDLLELVKAQLAAPKAEGLTIRDWIELQKANVPPPQPSILDQVRVLKAIRTMTQEGGGVGDATGDGEGSGIGSELVKALPAVLAMLGGGGRGKPGTPKNQQQRGERPRGPVPPATSVPPSGALPAATATTPAEQPQQPNTHPHRDREDAGKSPSTEGHGRPEGGATAPTTGGDSDTTPTQPPGAGHSAQSNAPGVGMPSHRLRLVKPDPVEEAEDDIHALLLVGASISRPDAQATADAISARVEAMKDNMDDLLRLIGRWSDPNTGELTPLGMAASITERHPDLAPHRAFVTAVAESYAGDDDDGEEGEEGDDDTSTPTDQAA